MIAFRFTASYTAILNERHTIYFTSERKWWVSLLWNNGRFVAIIVVRKNRSRYDEVCSCQTRI